jgi:hypothetical protein
MKRTFLLCLVFCSTISLAGIPSLKSVRILYQKAPVQKESCKKLIEILSPYQSDTSPLFAGYNGCATMMMAKYTFNPFTKLSYFKTGKHLLENAIEADMDNVELRFLRFAVQTQIPSFLRYSNSIDMDKTFLLQSLPLLKDDDLKKMITDYLQSCNYLTVTEKKGTK